MANIYCSDNLAAERLKRCYEFHVDVNIVEVDESSLFCLIRKKRTMLDISAGPI